MFGSFNDRYIPPNKPYKLRLEKVRKRAKLSQSDVASLLSTHQTQYSRWERGSYDIPIFELCMLSLYFNRSVDYLLGMSDDDIAAFSDLQRVKRIEAMQISSYFDKQGLWAELLRSLKEQSK